MRTVGFVIRDLRPYSTIDGRNQQGVVYRSSAFYFMEKNRPPLSLFQVMNMKRELPFGPLSMVGLRPLNGHGCIRRNIRDSLT
jgi:hypothetical protein